MMPGPWTRLVAAIATTACLLVAAAPPVLAQQAPQRPAAPATPPASTTGPASVPSASGTGPASVPPAPGTGAAPAASESARDGAGEAAPGPERLSAQFGDWAVQCVVLAQGRRVCEMAQTVQDQQRQQPVAVIAVGRLSRDQPMRLAVRVPLNVLVTQPAQVTFEGPAGPANEPLSLPFQRCTIAPVGCFAERELREEVLRRLRSRPAEQRGRVAWRDAGGAEHGVPISFRGFAPAYEALLREGG